MIPIQRIAWAREAPVGSRLERTVLLVLASYSDSDGRAFPSQRELAETCLVQEQAIRVALKGLLDGHTIRRSTRMKSEGRGRQSDAYELAMGPGPIDGSPTIGQGDQPTVHARPTDVLDTTNRRSTPPHIDEGDSEGDSKGVVQQAELKLSPAVDPMDEAFEEAWKAYPEAGRKRSLSRAKTRPGFVAASKVVGCPRQLAGAVKNFSASAEARKDGGQYVPGFHRFLKDGRYEHWLPVATPPPLSPEEAERKAWRSRLHCYQRDRGAWKELDWGPRPVNSECRAPHDLLVEFGFRDADPQLKIAGARP